MAVKLTAVAGVVGGAGAAYLVPLEAESAAAATSTLALSTTQDTALIANRGSDAASRSSERAAPGEPLVAPTEVAPAKPETVGMVGVKPVAKPTSGPTKAPASASAQAAPPTGSYTGGVSARCASIGVVPNAQRACTAVDSMFHLGAIGGRRGGGGDHGTGLALDLMTSNQAQGDAIAAYVIAHAGQFNVKYVIWRQRYYQINRGVWRLMEDRGSITANHYDHVHVSFSY